VEVITQIETIEATANVAADAQSEALASKSANDAAIAATETDLSAHACCAVPPNAAVGYARTSSAANAFGADKDSEARQRSAIESYAKSAGLQVAGWFYDAAVSGADAIDSRAGFAAMLAFCAEHGIKMIVLEGASRFSRDLLVQESGFAMLRKQGLTLIAADDPDAFTSDTPTAVMVRQILGAVSQFEKNGIVAKLKGARDRRSAAIGKRMRAARAMTIRRRNLSPRRRRCAPMA
jgi:DNA invertase Pin-like site-specific DNA recombinase